MPNKADLKLAAISVMTTADKAASIHNALTLVRKAAADGADWVQLPEMFPFMGPYSDVYDMAELPGGPLYQQLAALAKELGIILIAGSVGERPDLDHLPASKLRNADGHRKVFNTTYIFGRSGEELAKYRKIHLFNLEPEDGGTRYCESDGFIAGDQAKTVVIDGWQVALTICYDLRFPELYHTLAAKGPPDIILVPSAFTKATGKDHWELLLRARAVEHQAYVFAANQTGTHAPGKESFGHSMVVDPWGRLLATTNEEVGFCSASASKQEIKTIRARLPALLNRRPDVHVSNSGAKSSQTLPAAQDKDDPPCP